VFAALFAFMFDEVIAGLLAFMFEVFDVVLPAGTLATVLAGAGVIVFTGAGVVALLTFTCTLAASPQAKPRALKPRTVESAITFFIT
jgi:hypothetical protein